MYKQKKAAKKIFKNSNQVFVLDTPPPRSQDQNNTSFNYLKILKHCKLNDKCID